MIRFFFKPFPFAASVLSWNMRKMIREAEGRGKEPTMTQANEAGRRVRYTIFPIPPPFLEKYLLFLKQVRQYMYVCEALSAMKVGFPFAPICPHGQEYIHIIVTFVLRARLGSVSIISDSWKASPLAICIAFPFSRFPWVPRLFLSRSRSALAKTRK